MILHTWVSLLLLFFRICLANPVPNAGGRRMEQHGSRTKTWTQILPNEREPTYDRMEDMAAEFWLWLTTTYKIEEYGVGNSQSSLVSVLYVPDYEGTLAKRVGTMYASTIPRGTWNTQLVESASSHTPVWYAAAKKFINEDPGKSPQGAPLHAEDGAYILFEGQNGMIWGQGERRRYPPGSKIVTFGKRVHNHPVGPVNLCQKGDYQNPEDARDPSCQDMARILGVAFGSYQPADFPNPDREYLDDDPTLGDIVGSMTPEGSSGQDDSDDCS